MKSFFVLSFVMAIVLMWMCSPAKAIAGNAGAQPRPAKLNHVHPVVVTEMSRYDTDDPAIWINHEEPEKSLILGTDKDRLGALYVYDLEGKVLKDKVIRLKKPNNVDVEYGFPLAGRLVDIAVVTERGTQELRIFTLPDMQSVDGGGIRVFRDEPSRSYRSPMGVALYKRPEDGTVFAIVSRKKGPAIGYLWQYRLEDDGRGRIRGVLVRKFGAFSGEKCIEAIAVDDRLGYVYYSDERKGIRKYHANPRKGSEELALFGTEEFLGDREGIAVCQTDERRGFILVSDQAANRFHFYSRQGEPGQPHHHRLLKTVYAKTSFCDGCEVSPYALNGKFPHGLFVAMSDDKTFQLYNLKDLIGDDLNQGVARSERPELSTFDLPFYKNRNTPESNSF